MKDPKFPTGDTKDVESSGPDLEKGGEAGREKESPELARRIDSIEDNYKAAADELDRLGLSDKAEQVKGRISKATEAVRIIYELDNPELEDMEDVVAEEIARLHIEGQENWYSHWVDIADDNPDRESIIQFIYDTLGVDKDEREEQRSVGGPWGGGLTIAKSYTNYQTIGDKYVINEASDWPEDDASSIMWEALKSVGTGIPISVSPVSEEDKFTRVYIAKRGVDM